MDNKVSLQDLADGLARRRGITQDEATTFVKCVFDIVEQYISSDKLVKIKGLGTFKLVAVSNRESVDVNTGERILIQGHTKVSFQPDAGIADLVNKPFADFETTVLNDNIDMEALDSIVTPNLPTPAAMEPVHAEPTTEEMVLEDEEDSPTIEFVSEEPDASDAEEETTAAVAAVSAADEPVPAEETAAESPVDEVIPAVEEEAVAPEVPAAEEPVADEPEDEQTTSPEADSPEEEQVPAPEVVAPECEDIPAPCDPILGAQHTAEPSADAENAAAELTAMEASPAADAEESPAPSAGADAKPGMQSEPTIHQQVEVLKTQSQNVTSQQVSDLNVSTQHVEHQTIEQHVSASDSTDKVDSNHSVLHVSWRGVMALIIMVVLLMIGSYLAGYYELLSPVRTTKVPDVQPTVSTERVAAKPAPAEPKPAADSTKVKEEPVVSEQAPADEKPAEEVAEPKPAEETPAPKAVAAQEPAPKAKDTVNEPVKETPRDVKPAVPEKAKEPAIPSEQQETLVAQVRGSYKIIGTRGTHVVRDGDNISSIARATYGDPRMATYIIAYNNLSNPDIITAGTQLKLPELRQK